MLQDLIVTFEELKKYVFIIDRGAKEAIIIKFNNDNFYHLVGLHKTNIDMFFPHYIKSKDKKYKFIKKNVDKFNNILINQIKDKNTLELRIKTFHNILDLLKGNRNTYLYDLKYVPEGSMYNGDYGLLKLYEKINCLFGLKCEEKTKNFIYCVPQSWMASNRINKLTEFKRPMYMNYINAVPASVFNEGLEELNI